MNIYTTPDKNRILPQLEQSSWLKIGPGNSILNIIFGPYIEKDQCLLVRLPQRAAIQWAHADETDMI